MNPYAKLGVNNEKQCIKSVRDRCYNEIFITFLKKPAMATPRLIGSFKGTTFVIIDLHSIHLLYVLLPAQMAQKPVGVYKRVVAICDLKSQ
jgi:hypothetical protein